jgi:hypothetical protein
MALKKSQKHSSPAVSNTNVNMRYFLRFVLF